MSSIALYVHFPYCPYKCHYCDFNSYAVPFDRIREEAYLKALLSEMNFHVRRLTPFRVASVFLGGGTPSLFSPDSIGTFLEGVRALVPVEPQAEVTLEANPKTLDEARIDAYLKAGINRISVGVQSLKDKYLSPLGRLHTAEEAKEILKLLSNKQLNFNADFMFGFPGQTVNEVLEDLEEAVQFSPRHLSFYHLTLEKGTRFFEEHRRGRISLPDEDAAAEMYERGSEFLKAKGFPLYEISNFARPSFFSRHNLAYWRYDDYLGLGAGAVSFLKKSAFKPPAGEDSIYGCRWTNPRLPEEYLRAAEEEAPAELIDTAIARGEFWMMGLRLAEGVSLDRFRSCFGEGAFEPYQEISRRFEERGLLERGENRLRLTDRGRLLANEVVMGFLMD